MNKEEPLISIILPTYNRGYCLEKAINSVRNQTYKNWELIIVDNESKDNTQDILNRQNDRRIRVYTIQNSGSIGKSRNLGLEKSNGQWIAFLDSDDYWVEKKLARVMNEAKKSGADFIYHKLKISINGKESKNKTLKSWRVKKPVLKDLLLRGNPIANSSVVIKKNLLKEIGKISERPEINSSVDYHTWLRVAERSEKFHYIKEVLGVYDIHDENVSNMDMSLSEGGAIHGFLNKLNKKEKEKITARVMYKKLRYKYLQRKHDGLLKMMINEIKPMEVMLKLKTVYMIIILLIAGKVTKDKNNKYIQKP